MLAGTYARRPVIGAAVPLVATIVLERIIFKTNEVWEFIDNRPVSYTHLTLPTKSIV